MAAVLQHKAAQSVRPQPSTYYTDKKNPVIAAFEDECKLFIQFTKKKVAPGYKRKYDEASSRAADTLFGLWNKYESRLPRMLYLTRLIEMGDFLVSVKEYNMALWQCYGRYLDQFGDRHIEDITDIETVKEIFFPGGMENEKASLTFRALYGKSICNYQVVLMTDPKLQNTESVTRGIKILSFLRLITQVVLPKEALCWLVYNGTIHIYSVSRHLMTLGHSAKVLEYLLWACMCMETSVPLLTVKYLPWRTTLYTAVCQCYYDCRAAHHAESFARRALNKVNELSQLEKISSAPPSLEVEAIFRQSAVKIGVMVYKRVVFDTRKKPKGLLRPKTRSNLKDAQSLPWPRTPSEKLLADMFEGSAAQFLAILETISDSTRRTLLTGLPAPESEDHILDVFSELFFAGVELIAGGGGHTPRSPQQATEPCLFGVTQGRTLIDMATRGEDGISLSSVVKFVKWAYNYEQWETFDALVELTLEHIKELDDPQYIGDEKSLEMLLAMEPLNPNRKYKKTVSHADESSQSEGGVGGLPPPPTQASHRSTMVPHHDDMIHLAELLYLCVKEPIGAAIDRDMVVDATLYLWNKCKNTFQKFQTGASDSGKYLQRMDNPGKWVHILSIVHEVMYWCGISSVDPAVTAEVALRLALVLENNVSSDSSERAQSGKLKGKSGTAATTGDTASITGRMSADVDEQSVSSGIAKDSTGGKSPTKSITSDVGKAATSTYSLTILQQSPKDQLILARDILERALQGISDARQAVALTDGKSIADVGWVKELNPDDFIVDAEDKDISTEKLMESANGVRNLIMDLHMELLFMYHRVCLKLTAMRPDGQQKGRKPKTGKEFAVDPSMYIESIEELSSRCNKNLLSKALFYCQKTLMAFRDDVMPKDLQPILQEAMNLITKAQDQEYKLYTQNTEPGTVRESGVPPAPLLLCRTDSSMVFRPAPFNPTQKVAWYRLFARTAAGSNVKVRLNDYFLPGAGDEVPAYDCELSVSGLSPNERYVFAVAAYTADGELIGDSIGDTSKPILASHPLPVLMAWAFLSQVAYQVQCYNIAQTAGYILWDHFVAPPPPPDSEVSVETAQQDFQLTLRRLNKYTVSVSSPVLLRMFLGSIFINVDVSARDRALFSDKLCDLGPYYPGQMGRLTQSEHMLVAIELAGWLNESNMALQAVVQCYGLLAPLLHYKIPSIPVLQVLMRCQAVLQEVPVSLRIRRQVSLNDSLHHMIATITFYLTKVLRTTWRQRGLANNIVDSGKRMLKEASKEKEGQGKEGNTMDNVDSIDGVGGAAGTGNVHTKKKKIRRPGQMTYNIEGPQNEELRALEAHMLKLSKMAQSSDELTGSEDPNLLHAYIAALPSRHAYKEVTKFRRRTRFLEFLVLVVQKALTESQIDVAIDWCEETIDWLHKRNETLSAIKATLSKQPGAVTVAGDDPKKFAAAVVEYNKSKPQEKSPEQKSPRKKKRKYYLLVNKSDTKLSDPERMKQEAKEERAIDTLDAILPDYWHTYHRRKRLRKICIDELPWRCQMNILQGLCHFAQFLNKIDLREKFMQGSTTDIFRSAYLDHEWFTFETSGTLVVGWEGGPLRQATREDHRPPTHADPVIDALQELDFMEVEQKGYSTAIDIAAAAAIGNAPPPIPPPPDDKDDDTPRTYRSDESADKAAKTATQAASEFDAISVKTTIQELEKTFAYFQKAVVLAHRGHHWTLLQNACRSLWNCAHTALLRAFASNTGAGSGIITTDQLRQIVWKPFYRAADCLLDMMVYLQTEEEKRAKRRRKQPEVKVNTWMGSVSDEKGGASLKFEEPLDDITTIDARWTRRMVMRTIELLFYEQRWEKVAEIAMRFNSITQERYAQQVSPLLVQAQRKLINRVSDYGGPPPTQPHFQRASEESGGILITAHNYQEVQLRVEADPSNYKPIDPGGHIDPEGHDVYLGPADAYKLVCVPLDIKDSLSTLREALDVSHYVARALQHSRKLMVLYLAGHQNVTRAPSRMSTHSHVEFAENDGKPQGAVPADMMQEEFQAMADVQSSSLPRSQLSVVIASYDKTIEMLLARNYRGLASQAMHELGNLHYHSGNIRGAYKWWSEALDLILNTRDTLHTWRELVARNTSQQDDSAKLLDRCGLWGCLLAGILTAKIAQYILTSDLGLRMESCFLSAVLFKSLFRTTLPHPTADRDYALYEVGEGCEVQYLLPGIDLLSDRFRCDGRTLVACLRWVTEELSRGRHNLMVLPLLTLYQYFTTFMCRDLQRVVDGRILKVKILTDLGLFSEAITTLLRLLHGERLPQTADSNFRQVESKMTSHHFNTSKPLVEPINLKILETLLEKRLSPGLATLFGPHMTCHLSLVQSHLLTTIADTIACIPEFDEDTESPPEPVRKMSGSTFKSTKPPPSTTSKRAVPKTVDEALATEPAGSEDSASVTEDTIRVFTGGKSPPTVERIKGTLLSASEQSLTSLCETITEQGGELLSASELEIVVLCKLELAAIARQKHLSTSSADIVVSAMKMIQDSQVFDEVKESATKRRPSSMRGTRSRPEPVSIAITQPNRSSQYQYQNFQSRSRLDARLWLDCRLALVKGLMGEIRGMGQIGGKSGELNVPDSRQYCVEGLAEAEACGDVEMQAEFLLLGATIDLQEGRSLDDVKQVLQDVVEMLRNLQTISTVGQFILAVAIIQLTDLETLSAQSYEQEKGEPLAKQTLNNYLHAQNFILKQMMLFGEKVEHKAASPYYSTPMNPLQNIYLFHVLYLAKIKLRIGYTLARDAARQQSKQAEKNLGERRADIWIESAAVLGTALELCRVSAMREHSLEAEILLNLGKVQRQLYECGSYQPRAVTDTLIEAIKVSHGANHDLGLIHQAYLEIALVYLSVESKLKPSSSDSTMEREELGTTPKKTPSKLSRGSTKTSMKSQRSERELMKEKNRERTAAWIAVRAAAAVAVAQRTRSLMIGDSQLTSLMLPSKVRDKVPEFAVIDLVGGQIARPLQPKLEPYGVGLETVEEGITQVHETESVESEDEVLKALKAGIDVSWIHLLGYSSILQRLCNTTTLGVTADRLNQDNGGAVSLGAGFDLGYINPSGQDGCINHDVIRLPLMCGRMALRQAILHNFLATHLPLYASECVAVSPPSALSLKWQGAATELNIPIKKYEENVYVPPEPEPDEELPLAESKPTTGKKESPSAAETLEKNLVSSSENEISFQWYQPAFEDSTTHSGNGVLLLYAVNKEEKKSRSSTSLTSSINVGKLSLALSQLMELHAKLAVVRQKGEISLAEQAKTEQPKPPSQTSSATKAGSRKAKRTTRITQLSAKVKRDENLEALLKECIADIYALLNYNQDVDPPTEIPFPVSLTNIHSVEQMFDPNHGDWMKNNAAIFKWMTNVLA
ncbi:cilia- and flagella-associated protein 54-like [Glandiceps talaboti]